MIANNKRVTKEQKGEIAESMTAQSKSSRGSTGEFPETDVRRKFKVSERFLREARTFASLMLPTPPLSKWKDKKVKHENIFALLLHSEKCRERVKKALRSQSLYITKKNRIVRKPFYKKRPVSQALIYKKILSLIIYIAQSCPIPLCCVLLSWATLSVF